MCVRGGGGGVVADEARSIVIQSCPTHRDQYIQRVCSYVFYEQTEKQANAGLIAISSILVKCCSLQLYNNCDEVSIIVGICTNKIVSTVMLAKSDSDVMFCLQSYWGLIIDRSHVY